MDMEIIENLGTTTELKELLKMPAANQNISEQIVDLEHKRKLLEKNLLKYAGEPVRRPSKEHKDLKKEIEAITKKIKKLHQALKKVNSIREATSKLNAQHGKVKLNKTTYYWRD
jgi:esterase/lipase